LKIAYFDCFSGAAGDMIIGALLDAGLPFDEFKKVIAKLNLAGYEMSAERVTRNHIAGTKFNIVLSDKQPHRHPKDIIGIIEKSGLDDQVKTRSIEIFDRLAAAEAAAHGEPVEKVHFHEVGAVDAIIDICGAVAGLEMMGIEKIYCSPISLGTGSLNTDHGLMPVPAPATAELVKNVPVKLSAIESELTTPTGAAILTVLAEFSQPQSFKIERIGYGAGSRNPAGLPNLLRVMIGEIDPSFESDTVTVLETNLDRATPEIIGGLIDELLAAGALDVFVAPITMKKNRPGHLLTLLCEPIKQDRLAKIVFVRGTTLGIRVSKVARMKLKRNEVKVSTSGGEVRVKIGDCDGQKIILPEYADISAAMKKSGSGYDDIFFEIMSALRKEK